VVDDNDYLRASLIIALELYDDLQVVGGACNGQEAIRLCDELRPDVVLMDLMMPVMDGATAARHIAARHPNINVIALTSAMDIQLVDAAMKAGIYLCLFKNVSIDALASAIQSARETAA
jgi:NarL family two-component system response regulator LiaR